MIRLSGLEPVYYDCCVNSCCCFTGPFSKLKSCPYPDCHEPRFDSSGKPRKRFSYLPFTDRLIELFLSKERADRLDYRANFVFDPTKITDVFSSSQYRKRLEEMVTVAGKELGHRFFSDKRDIALGLAVDGFAPFRNRKQTCWVIILFNYNLPPDVRFHKDNIICVGVIPGPRQMKDIDSFLYPLVDEFLKLARGVPAFDVRECASFRLHAYLILAFGDIPAVAKLMKMKGHNALCPCRMCNIIGIRINTPGSKNPIHYVPLHRDEPNMSYSATNLPLRTHVEFMSDADYVDSASSIAEAERRAKGCGIKGLPILAALSSLEFPTCFPYDFMHLIWENVVKGLISLWTGELKPLKPDNNQPYRIKKNVWSAIGKATVEVGSTMPSAFGCRVPNIAERQCDFSAEAYSNWTTFLAPVLLREFLNDEYYDHIRKPYGSEAV